MVHTIVAVYDSKIGAFLPPLFVRNPAQGIRYFQSALADEKHDFGRYPADYTLLEIGTWDDKSGEIVPYASPTSIVTGLVALQNYREERGKHGL